jgi:peptidoglycan hydrolase FlgJ
MPRTVTKAYPDAHMQRIAEWTAQMLDAAEETARLIGCSPEAIVAQAALETGWGKSAIGHNIFGIKADSSWTGPKRLVTTREVIDGQLVTLQAWFRDYPTYADSIADHFAFLKANTRYADVFDPNNSMSDQEYFRHLQADGYATDPNYAHSLMDMLGSVQGLERHMAREA